MPFGLTNAPEKFQPPVNDVLRDFINDFVFVYLNYILIYPQDKRGHTQHVQTVLSETI